MALVPTIHNRHEDTMTGTFESALRRNPGVVSLLAVLLAAGCGRTDLLPKADANASGGGGAATGGSRGAGGSGGGIAGSGGAMTGGSRGDSGRGDAAGTGGSGDASADLAERRDLGGEGGSELGSRRVSRLR